MRLTGDADVRPGTQTCDRGPRRAGRAWSATVNRAASAVGRTLAGVHSEARLVGRVERSLALAPLWQLGHTAQRNRLERIDLAGAIAAVERGKLGELEFDVLAWLGEQWWAQGSPADGVVRFTWYRLGRDLFGSEPDGTNRRRVREAIGNLMGAVVTLSGIDVHTGKLTPSLFSDVHILRSVVRGRRGGVGGDAAADGGQREDTAEVRLEDWIVAQLLGDVSVVLDWQIQRELTGVAKRLWSYLAAREGDFDVTSFDGVRRLVVRLDGASAFEALGITTKQARNARLSLARAGVRVKEADPRFVRISVDRVDERPKPPRYELRVDRRLESVAAVDAPDDDDSPPQLQLATE